MIVGIIALITALLLGGNTESYFLVEDIDVSAKKVIVDTERKKEVLQIIKDEKKLAKSLFKERAANMKSFKKLYVSPSTSPDAFNELYELHLENLKKHQALVFNTRISALKSITTEEWDQIVAQSQLRVGKIMDKAQKKEAKKNKDEFALIQSSIEKNISNKEVRDIILTDLSFLKQQYTKIQLQLRERNVKNNKTIQNYNATYDDLNKIAQELNVERNNTFLTLVAFRLSLKNNTTDKQWKSIVKVVSKELI